MKPLLELILLFGLVAARPPGFSSLKVLPGAREAGMAGAGAASSTGPAAVAWNPAAEAGLTGFAAMASYSKWLLDTRQQAFFVSRGFSPIRVTVGLVSFSAGEFEYRVKPTEQPIGTFTPTDLTAYLSLARSLGPRIQLGLTGRYYYTRIMEYDGSGPGLDVGFRAIPFENTTISVSLLDFGKTISYQREVFWLPTRIRGGISHTLPLGELALAGTVDGSYFIYNRKGDVRAGIELAWNRSLFLRAGYGLFVSSPASLGLGARAGLVRLDYAYMPLGFDLGSTHRFAVTLGSLTDRSAW